MECSVTASCVSRKAVSINVCADLVFFAGLQQEQSPLYESLTKILEPADQQLLQGVIQEAEIRSIAAQQTHEQQSNVTQATAAAPQASPTRIGP